jgi:copper(I)-binding protein
MKTMTILTVAAVMLTLSSAHAQPMHGHKDQSMPSNQIKTMAGNIAIEAPWARASVGGNGAAYAQLVNKGAAIDRLIDAKSPVARNVEIHTHIMEGTVMRMRRVKDGIALSPGETILMKPGGYHIMLLGLHKKLIEGETFPVTFVFEKAGEIEIPVKVGKIGAMKPHGNMKGGGMHDSGMHRGHKH